MPFASVFHILHILPPASDGAEQRGNIYWSARGFSKNFSTQNGGRFRAPVLYLRMRLLLICKSLREVFPQERKRQESVRFFAQYEKVPILRKKFRFVGIYFVGRFLTDLYHEWFVKALCNMELWCILRKTSVSLEGPKLRDDSVLGLDAAFRNGSVLALDRLIRKSSVLLLARLPRNSSEREMHYALLFQGFVRICASLPERENGLIKRRAEYGLNAEKILGKYGMH